MANQYVVEVVDAQGTKRQECATLADARQLYSACVDGAENDPRKGYTRRVALVGLASGDTYYKWEYLPQAAPVAAQDCEVTRESVHIATIREGDTVELNGTLKTVCPGDIKSGFMGTTLFGDSYRLGTLPVIKSTPVHARPSPVTAQAGQLLGLNYQNTDDRKRASIKKDMRDRGFTRKTWPKTLEEVPQDLRQYFVMFTPDFSV